MQFRLGWLVTVALLLVLSVQSVSQAAKRKISASVRVPNKFYKIQLNNIYQVGDEIWVRVLVVAKHPAQGNDSVIKTVEMTVEAPTGKVQVFVVGRDWKGMEAEGYKYVGSQEMYDLVKKQKLAGKLKTLYARRSTRGGR